MAKCYSIIGPLTIPASQSRQRGFLLFLSFFFSLCCSHLSLAQNTVTLAWDPSPSEEIVGYNVYYGGSSGNYTNSITAGRLTSVTITNLVPGGTYYFAATAVDTFGLESDFSEEAVYTVPWDGAQKLEAASGIITAPFILSSNTVWQTSKAGVTTATTGGRAEYSFSIPVSGNYLVSMMVSAPHTRKNSLYVSIDGEPADPTMIWDVPVTRTFRKLAVGWRGNGTATSPQYSPKLFALSAGAHKLIVRGLEPETAFSQITIAPASAEALATSAAASAPLSLTDNPVLSLKPGNGAFVLSWPSSDTTWVLEKNDGVNQWNAVEKEPIDDGTNNTVLVSPESTSALFRLRRMLGAP